MKRDQIQSYKNNYAIFKIYQRDSSEPAALTLDEPLLSLPLDRLLSGYSVESSIQFFSPRLLNPTGDPSKLFATDFPAENHVLALNVVSESIGNDRAIIDASNTRTDAR